MDVSPSDGGIVKVDETVPSSHPVFYIFKSGTNVRLEAIPADGYVFDNWSKDLSGTANPITIVIDCNKTITASFSPTETTDARWFLVSESIAGLLLVGAVIIGLTVKRRAA